MANVYLGSELLNGGSGGGSLSAQSDAVAISELAIWSGTYQEYDAISTPDDYTIYFVTGKQTAVAATGFTISQTHTQATPNTAITFSVDSITGDADAQPGQVDADGYKWWITSTGPTVSEFTTPSGGTGIGTSQATATKISNSSITLNSSTDGGITVNVVPFEGDTQIGSPQAFNVVTISSTVVLRFNVTYTSSASWFFQCGGPTVQSTVTAGTSTTDGGSIRFGGEVDPDDFGPVMQFQGKTGDERLVTEICNNWDDGFGKRMYARTTDSTANYYLY
jgi:hypothetical protein